MDDNEQDKQDLRQNNQMTSDRLLSICLQLS